MNGADYKIIIPACEPEIAKNKFKNWLESNPDMKERLTSEDVLVDQVLTEVDGQKTCHKRYRVRRRVLESKEF